MKLLLENWRQYLGFLNKKQEGGGIPLYHATCSPPKSFVSGIDVGRAKGFGQGAGFYFWIKKEDAINHGHGILRGIHKEESCPERGLEAYIVVSDEPITPETFDIDYEVYVVGFAIFMKDNLQFFSENMEVFGMSSPRPGRTRKTAKDYFMKYPHQFRVPSEESGLIKLGRMGRVNKFKAASLSRIANKLAETNPEMFRKFEEQWLPEARAIKYNGKKTIYPLRIEDLYGNVVWSRK